MEGFDLISAGVLSILPPLLALGLALITKEVYSSLAIGVFTGMLIYQFTLNGAGFEQVVDSFTMVPRMLAEQISSNARNKSNATLLDICSDVIRGTIGNESTPRSYPTPTSVN